MSTNETLSYSDGAKGWPSFYSFLPEFMMGMNSFFYTFKNGNLYRHNTNEKRNVYYDVEYNSKITGVFNTSPLEIKLFKTMSFESDASWKVTSLVTDLSTGSMLSTFFEQKEGEWFSFIRQNASTINFKLRSAHGIGDILTDPTLATGTNLYLYSFANPIGNMIDEGDSVFKTSNPGTDAPIKTGVVSSVNNTLNTVTVDITGFIQSVVADDYILYYKNVVAESQGARGYFMQFTLENDNLTPVELFSVGSSVMKSYP
tara:strand:- start:2287 stop:3060 length:774 start_codon:yes stop_codon:yes gene_type:complete